MAKANYDEAKVVNQLLCKGIKIDLTTNVISIPDSLTIGIHQWGKIDFLKNYCGYKVHGISASQLEKERAANRKAAQEEKKQNKQKYKENKKIINAKGLKKMIK